MSKKTKTSKKHRFKHADSAVVETAPTQMAATVDKTPQRPVAAAVAAVAVGRDFSYVERDLRRITVLAVVLVALEVGLWWLLGHTGVGAAVYNWVQV